MLVQFEVWVDDELFVLDYVVVVEDDGVVFWFEGGDCGFELVYVVWQY